MNKFRYFAYGSNMLTRRLRERTPSAQPISSGTLFRYRLTFHKVGKDGSGKCHIQHTNEERDLVIGVLFDIDQSERGELDKAEGLGRGYDEHSVEIVTPAGKRLKARSYVGTRLDKNLKPYRWYKSLVVAGATEHRLPTEYTELLKAAEATEDLHPERQRQMERLAR